MHLLKLLSLGQVLHGLVNVDSLFVEKLLLLLGSTIHRILRLLVLVRLLMREVDIWLLAAPLRLHGLIGLVPPLLLHLLLILLLVGRLLDYGCGVGDWNYLGCGVFLHLPRIWRKDPAAFLFRVQSLWLGVHTRGLLRGVGQLARLAGDFTDLFLDCLLTFLATLSLGGGRFNWLIIGRSGFGARFLTVILFEGKLRG